jgi:hypothetical protein
LFPKTIEGIEISLFFPVGSSYLPNAAIQFTQVCTNAGIYLYVPDKKPNAGI